MPPLPITLLVRLQKCLSYEPKLYFLKPILVFSSCLQSFHSSLPLFRCFPEFLNV